MNASAHFSTTDATATDLLIRWAVVTDTGEGEFSRAEYDRLAVLFADDARELAFVLDAREIFHPTCTLCGGSGVVTVEHVSGSWADWHGPQVDYVDEACSACQPEAEWEPYHYTDSDLDVLYVQTVRDLRAAVA